MSRIETSFKFVRQLEKGEPIPTALHKLIEAHFDAVNKTLEDAITEMLKEGTSFVEVDPTKSPPISLKSIYRAWDC